MWANQILIRHVSHVSQQNLFKRHVSQQNLKETFSHKTLKRQIEPTEP